MPADSTETPLWLTLDIAISLRLQTQINKEGLASVRAQVWRQYRIRAEALYQMRERVGLEIPVSHDKYPSWLYAAEQESTVEALLEAHPRIGLIRRLVMCMAQLRFLDRKFPEGIVNAELYAALAETAPEPQLTQSKTDPGFPQTEKAAAPAEMEFGSESAPDPEHVEPEAIPAKRKRLPWTKVNPVLLSYIRTFGTPADKPERLLLIKLAHGELAKLGRPGARSSVELHCDRLVEKFQKGEV
jgi:hypothetical protein